MAQGSCGCGRLPTGEKVTCRDHEVLAVSKRLWEAVMEGTMLLGAFMKALFADLRVGGEVFEGREMSKEVEDQTYFETEGYVAALLMILLESWPNRPLSDLKLIHALLESMLLECQRADHRVELLERCQAYLARYREKRREDLEVMPRELVVHTEFAIRVGTNWPSLGVFTPKSVQFNEAIYDATRKVEAGLRRVLTELWPVSETSS